MTKNLKNQKGFTLIELLIVIVIIGILAGVLISVLNPVQQQNKARDASIRASINKVALSTKGLSAGTATGQVPTIPEFATGIGSLDGDVETCSTANGGIAADTECNFAIRGINLPGDCAAVGDFNGVGTAECAIRYSRLDDNTFIIAVKTFAQPRGVYVYAYEQNVGASVTDEGLFICSDESFVLPTAADGSVAAIRNNAACISAL